MKKHLFYAVLIIFCSSSIITLLGVSGVIVIQEKYLDKLIWAFLAQLAAAVISLFRKTDFFSEESVRRLDEIQSSVAHTVAKTAREEPSKTTETVVARPQKDPKDSVSLKSLETSADRYFHDLAARDERPLEREHWLEQVDGLKVEWIAEFADLRKVDYNRSGFQVSLRPIDRPQHLFFYDATEGERDILSSLRRGDRVKITGTLGVQNMRSSPTVHGGEITRIVV